MADDFRLLAISHPVRHPRADNHSIFNAPAVFDYDAIVVDPGGIFESILDVVETRAEHFTHTDTPVANGETTATHAGLGELLRRRQHEFARALERGALVVVFLHPQASIPASPPSPASTATSSCRAPGLGWDARLIQGGEGATAAVADHGHPFARVIDVLRQDLRYHAYFDDRAPGFAGSAHILARSAGRRARRRRVHGRRGAHRLPAGAPRPGRRAGPRTRHRHHRWRRGDPRARAGRTAQLARGRPPHGPARARGQCRARARHPRDRAGHPRGGRVRPRRAVRAARRALDREPPCPRARRRALPRAARVRAERRRDA